MKFSCQLGKALIHSVKVTFSVHLFKISLILKVSINAPNLLHIKLIIAIIQHPNYQFQWSKYLQILLSAKILVPGSFPTQFLKIPLAFKVYSIISPSCGSLCQASCIKGRNSTNSLKVALFPQNIQFFVNIIQL